MKIKLFFTSLNNIPLIVLGIAGLLLIAFYIYKFYKKQEAASAKLLKYTAWAIIGFRLIYSIVLSAMQYYTWKNDAFSKLFLPPNTSIKYFLGYSWTHFFAEMVFTVISAFVFYFILKAVKKYRAEIFEEGELELGLVCALIVGWPNVILFVSLSFLMLLLVSIFRQIFFKESFTTITLPMLISLPTIFIFGNKLAKILHLTALKM